MYTLICIYLYNRKFKKTISRINIYIKIETYSIQERVKAITHFLTICVVTF